LTHGLATFLTMFCQKYGKQGNENFEVKNGS